MAMVSSGDLREAHGPMFVVRFACRQGHDHGHARVSPGNRDGFVLEDCLDKKLEFEHEALGVALHEEVQRQISVNRFLAADHNFVGEPVFAGDFSLAAEDFDALIIAKDGFPAVVDGPDGAASEVENAQCGIDIVFGCEIRLNEALSSKLQKLSDFSGRRSVLFQMEGDSRSARAS